MSVDWVAMAGIASGVVISYMGIRSQRKLAHRERLSDRQLQVYEEYLGYCMRTMKRRHEQMTAAVAPADPHPADADEDIPMLNRLTMYASSSVLKALRHADRADQVWRETCAEWQSSSEAETLADRAEVMAAWTAADVATERVMDTIRREVLKGRPMRLRRLGRRFRREVRQRTVHAMLADANERPDSGA